MNTYYKYTGDPKMLKHIGFKFHKLYANNYKAYNLKNIWLFVKGGYVIEIDNINHEHWYTVIKFILDNKNKPVSFWSRSCKSKLFQGSTMPEHRIIDGIIYNYDEKIEKNRKIYEELKKNPDSDIILELKDGVAIDFDLVTNILLLEKFGKFETIQL
jgi:hypothetical protein